MVIGGGDGTLNAAIPGLLKAGLPFGIMPLGTANDLARSLGIPFELDAAAQVIATAAPRPVDLGEVNGHPYFNVASIGFSADLAAELKAEAKQRWGKLGYGVAALGLLRRARPFTATLIHDGRTERVRTIQVSVGNGRHYGGGMTVSEDARPDDGVLDVYSLEVTHWWRLVALLPWLRRGTQGAGRRARLPHHGAGTAHAQAAPGEYRWRADHAYAGGVPAAARRRCGSMRRPRPRPEAARRPGGRYRGSRSAPGRRRGRRW